MRTDYDAPSFATRYIRARPLDQSQQGLWRRMLADAVPADEVAKALDLGAGVGRFWHVLYTAWQPDIIVAVDRSSEMLSSGRAERPVVRIIGDIDAVPLKADAVDACFCSMAIHYSVDPVGALSRLCAVVRPGGYLCIRTATTETIGSFEFMQFFPTAKTAELRVMPSHDTLLRWIRDAGFETLQVTTVVVPVDGTRLRLLRRVLVRGFPSLQLVPRAEFVVGWMRLACHLATSFVRHNRQRDETVVLAVARRSKR